MLSPENEKYFRELVGDSRTEEEIVKLVYDLTDAEFGRRLEYLEQGDIPAKRPHSRPPRRPS